MRRAGDRARLLSVLRVLDDPLGRPRAGRADRSLVTWSKPHPEYAGMDLARGRAADGRAAGRSGRAAAARRARIYFSMDEADVQRILAFEPTMIGSDGLPHDAVPHPRLWATFPRVLGHYARDARPVPARDRGAQDDRAHRADLRPAGSRRASRRSVGRHHRVRSADRRRGRDLRAADRARARHRHRDRQRRIVWRDGKSTGARPGQVLRRSTSQP